MLRTPGRAMRQNSPELEKGMSAIQLFPRRRRRYQKINIHCYRSVDVLRGETLLMTAGKE